MNSTSPRFTAGAVDLGALNAPAQHPQTLARPHDVYLVSVVTPQTFERDLVVRSTQVPVAILFGSQQSASGQQMREELSGYANAQGTDPAAVQWLLRYVDVDVSPEIAQALKVSALPTVIALVGGAPIASFQGLQSGEPLQQWLKALLDNAQGKLSGLPADSVIIASCEQEEARDERLDQAEEFIEQDKLQDAINIYGEILKTDPRNSEVQAAKAQIELLLRQELNENSVVDASEESPLVRADALILAGEREQAVELLLERIAHADSQERAEAQQRLIDLLKIFENSDPFVTATRQKLASLLF